MAQNIFENLEKLHALQNDYIGIYKQWDNFIKLIPAIENYKKLGHPFVGVQDESNRKLIYSDICGYNLFCQFNYIDLNRGALSYGYTTEHESGNTRDVIFQSLFFDYQGLVEVENCRLNIQEDIVVFHYGALHKTLEQAIKDTEKRLVK